MVRTPDHELGHRRIQDIGRCLEAFHKRNPGERARRHHRGEGDGAVCPGGEGILTAVRRTQCAETQGMGEVIRQAGCCVVISPERIDPARYQTGQFESHTRAFEDFLDVRGPINVIKVIQRELLALVIRNIIGWRQNGLMSLGMQLKEQVLWFRRSDEFAAHQGANYHEGRFYRG